MTTQLSDESLRGIGSVDKLSVGFPCQKLSQLQETGGFEDARGTYCSEKLLGSHLFSPKYLFPESMLKLLNHTKMELHSRPISKPDELGYNVRNGKCLSKRIGVPPNRERVFTIGHLREENVPRIFPLTAEKISQLVTNQS